MAIDRKPPTWIPGWSEDGTNISIADCFGTGKAFPEMTAAEADATTGDICNVLYAVLCAIYAKWVATTAADRPTKMSVFKAESTNVDTGKVTTTFTLQFTTSIAAGAQNVDTE